MNEISGQFWQRRLTKQETVLKTSAQITSDIMPPALDPPICRLRALKQYTYGVLFEWLRIRKPEGEEGLSVKQKKHSKLSLFNPNLPSKIEKGKSKVKSGGNS